MEKIETVVATDGPLAIIVRADTPFDETTFVTPDDFTQQVGFVVYGAGAEIRRHVHLPLHRDIVGTSEALVVRSGACEVDLYDEQRRHVATRELRTGDVILLARGGHGFRMLEDTVLLELKQGPYLATAEKDFF